MSKQTMQIDIVIGLDAATDDVLDILDSSGLYGSRKRGRGGGCPPLACLDSVVGIGRHEYGGSWRQMGAEDFGQVQAP